MPYRPLYCMEITSSWLPTERCSLFPSINFNACVLTSDGFGTSAVLQTIIIFTVDKYCIIPRESKMFSKKI